MEDHPEASGGVTRWFVRHRVLGWVAMLAVLVWGWFSVRSLPQQEDPSFPTHDAVLVTMFPGTAVDAMEERVTTKLEETIQKLGTVENLTSRTRAGVSVIVITLVHGSKEEIAREWDQLRGLLDKVALPEGCERPLLDTEYQLPATLLLSITSPAGLDGATARFSGPELTQAAQKLADELRQLPGVGRLRLTGAASEGPSPALVETLHRGRDGALRGFRSVLLAVEMKKGGIIGEFDEEVRAVVARSVPTLAEGVEVLTVSDQPAATAHRINQFQRCFIEAVLVVVLVAMLLMDWRTAVVVAIGIPLTVAMTFGGMALLGVPLQQISIAALIIALGMLVDDPVVAADGINRELAAGKRPEVAAWLGPYKLRRAIFFGTVINIAAFLPLALLPGDMGAFIISLPVVITLALVSSRVVSMTFIPLLGRDLLRGQRGFEAGGEVRTFFLLRPVDRLLAAVLPRYRALLESALRHPLRTVAVAVTLLALSFGLIPFFGQQFFPAAERNQMLVDLELPEGSSLSQTQEVCRRISAVLAEEPTITEATMALGTGVPMFYYNVLPREPGPHVAQILINTKSADEVPGLLVKLRSRLDKEVTEARCIVKQLQQGPALETPIQIQITGEDLEVLRDKAAEVRQALTEAGAYKVHDDLPARMAMPHIVVNERAAALGLTAGALAKAMLAAPAGGGEWEKATIPGPDGQPLPFKAVACIVMKDEYPVISHLHGRRTVTVKAFAPFGELASSVLQRAKPAIERVVLPAGWSVAYAGEELELKKSQLEMSRVMAISLALIALAMLVQFRSFMKSLVVMLTVPLGLIGAFVGLAVGHASFGFMALLGIVSLAGVIVSHIIVLSDFIEEARREGMPLEEALVQAGLVRLRAVLATVFATVCGLIPLAVSGGQLWQPLTSVHIFGLLFGTLLTLLLLPVLYYLFCAKLKWIK